MQRAAFWWLSPLSARRFAASNVSSASAVFHRDPRSVSLTEAGETLLPHARAALAAAERGRDAIVSLRGMLRGRLRIGVAGPGRYSLDHLTGHPLNQPWMLATAFAASAVVTSALIGRRMRSQSGGRAGDWDDADSEANGGDWEEAAAWES